MHGPQDHLKVLKQRRDWVQAKILKEQDPIEATPGFRGLSYYLAERSALDWAIRQLDYEPKRPKVWKTCNELRPHSKGIVCELPGCTVCE